MADHIEFEPEILCGRLFTVVDFQTILEINRLFPKLSQNELALTICESLSWFAPNGKCKLESCRKVLNTLEERGWVNLPKKRQTLRPGVRREQVEPGAQTDAEAEMVASVSELGPVELEPVRTSKDIRLWNEYVERYHMLGYKRPFGAHQRYFIWSGVSPRQRLGCLLFSAAAWALSERDSWIGWNKEDRSKRLHLVVNNTRFLIFPWVKVKNLASKALSLAVKRVPVDWIERYGFAPVLLETFVDTAHYTGTCYRAANWLDLGLTAGRGRMDRYNEHALSRKRIFVYPLVPSFRANLQEEAAARGAEQ